MKLSRVLLVAVVALLFGHRGLAEETIGFRDVLEVFEEHCLACHNASRPRAGLDLSSYQATLAGSDSAEVVVSGDPIDSYLYAVTAHLEEPVMPPGGDRIPDDQIKLLEAWILAGLPEKPVTRPAAVAGMAESSQQEPAVEEPSEGVVADAPAVPGTPEPVIALDASDAAQMVAVGGQANIALFESTRVESLGILPTPEGEVQTVRFSRDGRWLIAGVGVLAESGAVVVWDLATGGRAFEASVGYDAVLAADRSPDGRWVVCGGPDRLIRVFDTTTGDTAHALDKHTDWVLDAAFSPDGLLFATADRDGGVYVWETHAGELVHSMRGHKDAVTRLQFDSARDELWTASEDGSLRRWDLHTGATLRAWTAHEDGVLGLALGASGAVSVGRDGFLRRWDSAGEAVGVAALDDLPTALAVANGVQVVGHFAGGLTRHPEGDDDSTELILPVAAAPFDGVSRLAEVSPQLLPVPTMAVAAQPDLGIDESIASRLASIRRTLNEALDEVETIGARSVEREAQRHQREAIERIAELTDRRERIQDAVQSLRDAASTLRAVDSEATRTRETIALLELGESWLSEDLQAIDRRLSSYQVETASATAGKSTK